MALHGKTSELHKLLQEKLRHENVKLWEKPYTVDGQKAEEPTELAVRYSSELGYPVKEVQEELELLRVHSVKKLQANQRFRESGIATVTVLLTGDLPEHITKKPEGRTLEMQSELSITGQDFKRQISSKIDVDAARMKLIASGKVLTDDAKLQDQGLTHQSQVMVICLSQSQADIVLQEEKQKQVAETKKAAELLAKQSSSDWYDNYHTQASITDQHGNEINMPENERHALTLALTLHEKGRAALKRKDHATALLLFLEADQEFNSCQSKIVDMVDNYPNLCLDIVWCYLCLKSIQDLPQAVIKLEKSQKGFDRSYGKDLERLKTLKGGSMSSGPALALYVRLYLLQGIVAYHQKDRSTATQRICQAEFYLKQLEVDPAQLTQLMEMGYTGAESRLALRMFPGEIDKAAEHIAIRREEKRLKLEREEKEYEEKKLQRSLGKTISGDAVNLVAYQRLLSMGYDEKLAAKGLREANNDIQIAMDMIVAHPDWVLNSNNNQTADDPDIEEHLQQLSAMGFPVDAARNVLQQHGGDINRAIENLAQSGAIPQSMAAAAAELVAHQLSSDSGSEDKIARKRQKKEETRAINELVSDLHFNQNEEDYLDLTLEEEKMFIDEYKALLASTQKS